MLSHVSPNSRAAYRSDIEQFLASGLSPHQYVLQLQVSSRSIARKVAALRSYFRELGEEVELESPRVGRYLPRVLSESDVDRLIEAASGRDRAILSTLYATGCRVSELCAIELDDLRGGECRVLGKGGRERVVLLSARACEDIDNYLAARESRSSLLFPVNRSTVFRIVQHYGRRIGREVSPHTLRHSFATHMLLRGASLRDIQDMLGHAKIGTTVIYTHLDSRRLKATHSRYHPRG